MVDQVNADVLAATGARLGELPRCCATRQRLLWVDVDAGLLHETDSGADDDHTHDV